MRARRRALRWTFACTLAFALLLSAPGADPALAAPSVDDLGSAAAAAHRINTRSRSSVVAAYQDWLTPTQSVPTGWTGLVEGCRAGTITAADRAATLSAVNYMRAMAGLAPVTLNRAFSRKSQAAALIMMANQYLTHYPPKSARCYTSTGAEGAHHGLLFLGWGGDPEDALAPSTGARAVVGYLADPGDGNEKVGHRRWLLYQALSEIGTGDTSISNSIYVVDRYHAPQGTTWVPWPTAGYFPRELEPDGRWSLSYPGADFTRSRVRVSTPDGPVSTTRYPIETGFADNTVSWGMELPDAYHASTDDYPVTVSVRDIRLPGGKYVTRTWTTALIAATAAPAPIP